MSQVDAQLEDTFAMVEQLSEELPTKVVDLRLYRCDYVSGNFNLHDHSDYKWVDKEELLDYDLAPADIPLAEYVRKVK